MKPFSTSAKPVGHFFRFVRAAILAILLIAIGASLGFCIESGL
ncbi:MAG: hypothetical protein P8J27_00355 [Mariniblastus sp.]|nr:hypothetical protein [Mariniblastus sp.]